MNRYEMIYILNASLEDSVRVELVERFSKLITDNGGEIEKVDEWGKRRLAYAIDYKTEGYYVLTVFKSESELPKELERNLEINENVIRYLVIKLLDKRATVKPRAVRQPAQSFNTVTKEAAEEAITEPVTDITANVLSAGLPEEAPSSENSQPDIIEDPAVSAEPDQEPCGEPETKEETAE